MLRVRSHAAKPYLLTCKLLQYKNFSTCVAAVDSASAPAGHVDDTLVAAVVFERPPIVLRKPHPQIAAFREFSFQWDARKRVFYRNDYIDKFKARDKDDVIPLKTIPATHVTEAEKSNDRRSLQRALDERLYLIVQGTPFGSSSDKPVWHFPEKLYTNEETLRRCAESALNSFVGDLSSAFFVGNAPCGYLNVELEKSGKEDPSTFKRFYFKSQVIGKKGSVISKCKDYVWATKSELLEYFDENERAYLDKMLMR